MDSDVEVYDVLAAMASSLVEDNSLFRVPETRDRKVELRIGGKPPREIFYRKTELAMTKIPPPILPKRCTCKYLCTGAAAVIKCFSCTLFDPTGVGFFCALCFKNRHPWYRVPHMFVDIDNDENIEYTMKVAHFKAEAARYEAEGKEILVKLSGQQKRLDSIGNDEWVDTTMRVVGRRTMNLEKQLQNLRHGLRAELRKSGASIEFTVDEATVLIQRVYKGFRIRKLVSLLYCERIVRVWDTQTVRDFFHDKRTGLSSWIPPRFLLRIHLDKIEYIKDATEKRLKWAMKRDRKRRRRSRIIDSSAARGVVAAFLRCVAARGRLRVLADLRYRRVWDEEYGTYFYADTRTGQTSWNKPACFLEREPPVLLLDSAPTNFSISPSQQKLPVETASKSKISPRINRLKHR